MKLNRSDKVNDAKELLPAIEQYLSCTLAELPHTLKVRLKNIIANILYVNWDNFTPTQRRNEIVKMSQRDDEYQRGLVAAWHDDQMDASAWWSAESITPVDAAMLLSRFNPIKAKIEDAERDSSDEMGPEDFRRLKHIFEGANKANPRTLKDWLAYASLRGLKVHSWINAWVNERDARAAPGPSMQDTPRGITKQQVITAFDGLHFNAEKWGKYLASPAPWLIECRTQQGAKSLLKKPSLWNPVLIAVALSDDKRKVPIKKLDAVFVAHIFLKPWCAAWTDASAIFR